MRTIIFAFSLIAAAVANGHAGAAEFVVKMKFDEDGGRFYFDKAAIFIQPGDKVTWVQDDAKNEHDVVAYPGLIPAGVKLFKSPLLKKKGQKWSMTFKKVGTYFYHCHPHEAGGMRGWIVVGRPSRPDEFRKALPGESAHRHHGDHAGSADDRGGKSKTSMVKWTKPSNGAELKSPPSKIEISFAHPMRLTLLKLTTETGELIAVDLGSQGMGGKADVPVPALAPDDYTVEWRAKGKDGHVMSGSFTFSVVEPN